VNDAKSQSRLWSRQAARYDDVFLVPFRDGVENPLFSSLAAIPDRASKTIIDLGCGTGPLLPYLVETFGKVMALDFAPGMIERAEARLGDDAHRARFLTRTMDDLGDLGGFDVAVAVNSIVMPDTRKIDETLRAVHAGLRPDGWFLGVVPSIDAIHYHTMLLMDRALDSGRSPEEAERYAAFHAEHAYYDFAFGRFRFQGLRQKFWQPFELEYRLKKAGFASIVLDQLFYPWDESIIGGEEFADQPKSWDWTFLARPS
jgi:SAM-dependent methyltransferase